jgi:hypothetical protein
MAAWQSGGMMRVLYGLAVAILACFAAAAQPTQTPAYILKFREFQAAYQAGDHAGADAAGAEALRLAQADGAKPATVQALAANLAGLRLKLGMPDVATPLAQAVALAGLGHQAVTPSSLQLLQAWSDLDKTRGSRTRLSAAIRNGADAEIGWRWGAAESLARAASEAGDWTGLRDTGDLALAAAEGADFPAQAARGRALTLRGAGRLMNSRGDLTDIRAAEKDFDEAVDLLSPFAGEGIEGVVNLGVQMYAEAGAWRGAARSMLVSYGGKAPERPPEEKPVWAENLCRYDTTNLKIEYPADAVRQELVGALTALTLIGPDNRIIDFKVVAEVPRAKFAEAARKATIGLIVKPKAINAPDCRKSYWLYYYFNFAIR